MKITNIKQIHKYVKRDYILAKEFNKWIRIIKLAEWKKANDIKKTFKDVDTISKNIFIFNIKSSRSLCIVYFADKEIDIIWVGNHDDYDKKFNSKKKILKFIQNKGYE